MLTRYRFHGASGLSITMILDWKLNTNCIFKKLIWKKSWLWFKECITINKNVEFDLSHIQLNLSKPYPG